jgi:CheY-like chemotaxis protein
MQDEAVTAGSDGADATFRALRDEFLEDSTEELQNLISFLNEAVTGGRPMEVALRDARRAAVGLIGGASGFELPLIGVTAQRFDDYIASLSATDTRALGNLITYAETLLDLLAAPDRNEETAPHLMRRLPAKGSFDPDEIDVREIEVLLVMSPGVATRVIERELLECGYRVTTVGNSFKALEFASRALPDLIIVSAILPDLDGIDLMLALKAMPATRNIGAALITSLDTDHPSLQHLPPTVPIIKKSASFGDDLAKALQDQFLL